MILKIPFVVKPFFRTLLISTTVFFAISGSVRSQTKSTDTLHEEFVDLGSHKLFISRSGPENAKYTIVFESGAGGTSQDWSKVRAALAPSIKTIAYDRAGAGKSGAGPLPRTLRQEVFELHQILKSERSKSIILVGQSIGGLLVRLYAGQYEKNVAGLVLVDPTHESAVLGSMRYGGWVRLREKATGKPIPNPQLGKRISPGYDSTVDYMAEEFQQIYLHGLKNARQLRNHALIVLGAGKRNKPPGTADEQWKEIRNERDKQIQDLANLSLNSKFIVDPASGHAIHYDNPELVAKSIEMIIKALETNRPLLKLIE